MEKKTTSFGGLDNIEIKQGIADVASKSRDGKLPMGKIKLVAVSVAFFAVIGVIKSISFIISLF